MSETRQPFSGLSHWEIVFWYALIVASTAIFLRGRSRGRPVAGAWRVWRERGQGA